MATKLTKITNLVGPQGVPGPQGVQGLPGVNAVANDAATAAQITAAESETKSALQRFVSAPVPAGLGMGAKGTTLPKPTKTGVVIATPATVGSPSLYWPCVIRVDAIPALGHKYAMFVSTDHDTGAGGIWRGFSDDGLTWGSWSQVFVDTTSGSQTETPTVWWNPNDSLFYMLYQQKGVTGSLGGQVSLLATSPDTTTWTRVGIALDEPYGSFFPAANIHFGYAKVLVLGDRFVAISNGVGGDFSALAVSYSYDGRSWVTDPRPVYHQPHLATDTLSNVNLGTFFEWRGQIWTVGTDKAPSSGGVSVTAQFVAGPLRDDLRGFAAQPRPFLPVGEYPFESSNLTGEYVFVDDGTLFFYYMCDSNLSVATLELSA